MPAPTAALRQYKQLRLEAIERMRKAIAEGRHEDHVEAVARQAHEVLASLGAKMAARKPRQEAREPSQPLDGTGSVTRGKEEAEELSKALDDLGLLTHLGILALHNRKVTHAQVTKYAAVKVRNLVARVAEMLDTNAEKPARDELEKWSKFKAQPLPPWQEYGFDAETLLNDAIETHLLRVAPRVSESDNGVVKHVRTALVKEALLKPQSLASIAKQELEKKRG